MSQSLLVDHLWSPTQTSWNRVRSLVLIFAAILLLTVSAKTQVAIAFQVPMTLQTMVLVLLPMILRRDQSIMAISGYLALGASGMPVFSQGGGIAYFGGPTGGYLCGFFVATVLLSGLAQRGWDKKIYLAFPAMLAANSVILLCGFSWLAMQIGAERAWFMGVAPFLLTDALKVALAACTLSILWKLRGR